MCYMKQPVDTFAHNLQMIRESRGLSLDKLAAQTGVSKSMLRQIEIGQSQPTIATMWKIANGLRIPFTSLLREASHEITLGAFKGDTPLGEEEGYRLFPLIAFNPERSFETYYVEIDPGAVLEAESHQGNAEEHVFVLGGQFEISVAGESYGVNQAEFISFQANCAHRYHNPGKEMAAAIMMISYLP